MGLVDEEERNKSDKKKGKLNLKIKKEKKKVSVFATTHKKLQLLEEELYNDYKAVYEQYMDEGKSALIDEFTQLLIKHAALKDKEYINKIQLAIQLEEHVKAFSNIKNKYTEK